MSNNPASSSFAERFKDKIIDGGLVSRNIESLLLPRIDRLKQAGVIPSISVILVGENKASVIYVRNKRQAAERCGIQSSIIEYPESVSQGELLNKIEELNNDPLIHGILVQVPLPSHISEKDVMNAVSPYKDVDGFHPLNVGKIFTSDAYFYPCTPYGIIQMLDFYGIGVKGKNCVIVGQSHIVGKPLAIMLMNRFATVVSLNVFTPDIKKFTLEADILISATGKPHLINASHVKEGAVIVDVGISRINGRICGDVDMESAAKKVSMITPVPGGVGPVTVSALMENTVKAAELYVEKKY